MTGDDINDLDDVCRELGIQDSHVTPAQAARELYAEIERLRAIPTEQYPAKGISEPAGSRAHEEAMSNNEEIEKEIVAKGLTHPRVTLDLIKSKVVDETYYRHPSSTLTICILTLQNGFVVTGESAAASPENFDETIGRKIAHGNALQKIWGLEGYLLREQLHRWPVARRPIDETDSQARNGDLADLPK